MAKQTATLVVDPAVKAEAEALGYKLDRGIFSIIGNINLLLNYGVVGVHTTTASTVGIGLRHLKSTIPDVE